MTAALNTATPKGITLSYTTHTNQSEMLIRHRTAGMLGLKLFALVWCGGWLGITSFFMITIWGGSGASAGVFSSAFSALILPLFFLIGLSVSAYFAWLLLKRTDFTLGKSTLSVVRQLGSFTRAAQYEKSNITRFSVVQDGGQGEDSFLSFAVQAQTNSGAVTLLSRQQRPLADWLCAALNQWLGKSKSSIFNGHDHREDNDSGIDANTNTNSGSKPAPLTATQQNQMALVRKWGRYGTPLFCLAVALTILRDPISYFLGTVVFPSAPILESPVPNKYADSKFQIDHVLKATPITLDTTEDVTWRLTTQATGKVAIEHGKLVLKLDSFGLYDRFPCQLSGGKCTKVVDVQFALAAESGKSFSTIARSDALTLNAALPATGYRRGFTVITFENERDISAIELATAWPIITVTMQIGDGNTIGSSHHTPMRDAWRTALIAGSAQGDAFWQQGCNAATSLWAIMQMRCDAQLAQALERGAPLHTETGMGSGASPLMHAVDANNLDALTILLKRDFDVNQLSAAGYPAIHRAAERGYTEMVQRLIAAGANVNGGTGRSAGLETPLVAAASFRRWDSVMALLQGGANPNTRNFQGWAPIDYVVHSAMNDTADDAKNNGAATKRVAALKLLLDKGARADETIPVPTTEKRPEYQQLRPLIYAAQFGDIQAIPLLLARDADINKPNSYGMTPLMLAVKARQEAAVTLLLAAQADLKRVDAHGRTALNYATFNATPAIVKKVAAAGADLNFASPAGMHHGETALMHAVQGGNIETLKTMLALGAKTSVSDAKRPLHNHIKPNEFER